MVVLFRLRVCYQGGLPRLVFKARLIQYFFSINSWKEDWVYFFLTKRDCLCCWWAWHQHIAKLQIFLISPVQPLIGKCGWIYNHVVSCSVGWLVGCRHTFVRRLFGGFEDWRMGDLWGSWGYLALLWVYCVLWVYCKQEQIKFCLRKFT